MPASKNTLNVLQHKRLVASYLEYVVSDLFERAIVHDDSKFGPEEFDLYEEALPKFEKTVYGSPEYIQVCRDIKPAIQHHLQVNRHHPEYFEFEVEGIRGINQMTLIDLIEMVCDWLAASQRNGGNGDIDKGLDINKERYGIDAQLFGIIKNTVAHLKKDR